MSDDWLDIEEEEPPPKLPAVPDYSADYVGRLARLERCWKKLNIKQRTFLAALRECRFNQRKASRVTKIDRRAHIRWQEEKDYATVLRMWTEIAGADALDKDRLLARQDDIVETLMTPKPILYQGNNTGYKEVEASAAARANETLMKAAGLLKDKELEINVGLIGPSLNIQVVQQDGTVQQLANTGVSVQLAEPLEADWTEVSADGT